MKKMYMQPEMQEDVMELMSMIAESNIVNPSDPGSDDDGEDAAKTRTGSGDEGWTEGLW